MAERLQLRPGASISKWNRASGEGCKPSKNNIGDNMSNIDWLEVRHTRDNMSKIDELKAKLIEYDWTKDIALACDICKWLHKELIKQPKKIEVKEG